MNIAAALRYVAPFAGTFSLSLWVHAAPRIDYNRDVRPILSDNCLQCHGPDAKKREADLRLDTREGLFSKIDDIFPVVPGDPEKSEAMIRILSRDADEKMPPAKAKKTLKPEQI